MKFIIQTLRPSPTGVRVWQYADEATTLDSAYAKRRELLAQGQPYVRILQHPQPRGWTHP